MAWFKVDDGLAFNVKVMAAGNAAIGLWVRAGSWSASQMTDGFVPKGMVLALGASEADAEALASAGLWTPVEAGWQFHDWSDYQPTRADILDRREKRAEAGRAGGLASGRSRKTAGQSAAPSIEAQATTQALASPRLRPRANTRPVPDPSSSVPTERAATSATAGRRGKRDEELPESRIASAVYDHAKGMVGWVEVQQIAKRALRSAGATEAAVQAAVLAIYDAGKPITLQTVGQALAGRLSQPSLMAVNGRKPIDHAPPENVPAPAHDPFADAMARKERA